MHGDALSGIWTTTADGNGNGYDHAGNTLGSDASNILYLNADAELTLRDCVFDKDGVDVTADKTTGGYIGTGTLARQGSDEKFCRAIYNGGTLNVISAQILSTKEAVFTVQGSTTNIGENNATYGELTNGEDNSNNLIDIIGDVISVSIEGADAVNVYGGIIAGSSANGVGIRTTGETGVTTIHSGCIYGKYANDVDGSTDLSLHVNGGTVYLNIDEAHGISKTIPGERFLTTTVPEGNQTSATHHVGNVKTENGKLYASVDNDQDLSTLPKPKADKAVSEHMRINGTLDCVGGTTVFYQGVVSDKTTVTGKDTGADYVTEFFVNDGHFAGLEITGLRTYTFKANATGGAKRLDERAQIHGGAYQSITVNLPNGIGVQEILGFWNSTYNMDEKSATTAKEWIQYNHYAERNVSGTRDASGYWISSESESGWIKDVPAKLSDAGRAPNEATLTAADNSAIVVRDALWEFNDWLTKDNPEDVTTLGAEYALAVNLWLDASNAICTDYFHCHDGAEEADVMVSTGMDLRELQTPAQRIAEIMCELACGYTDDTVSIKMEIREQAEDAKNANQSAIQQRARKDFTLSDVNFKFSFLDIGVNLMINGQNNGFVSDEGRVIELPFRYNLSDLYNPVFYRVLYSTADNTAEALPKLNARQTSDNLKEGYYIEGSGENAIEHLQLRAVFFSRAG